MSPLLDFSYGKTMREDLVGFKDFFYGQMFNKKSDNVQITDKRTNRP